MEEIILKAEPRVKMKSGNSKRMLKADFLPVVVYGPGVKNLNLKVKYQEFLKVLDFAGESKVINLKIEDKTIQVFIHKVQKDPISGKVIHVDFYQFDKNHKFNIEVPINFIGESKAVKEVGGVLIKNIDSVLVECLYSDLISEIEVDLSVLENLNDTIYVSDLKVNKGVNFLISGDRVVATVKPMRAQEEKTEVSTEENAEKPEETTTTKDSADSANDTEKDTKENTKAETK